MWEEKLEGAPAISRHSAGCCQISVWDHVSVMLCCIALDLATYKCSFLSSWSHPEQSSNDSNVSKSINNVLQPSAGLGQFATCMHAFANFELCMQANIKVLGGKGHKQTLKMWLPGLVQLVADCFQPAMMSTTAINNILDVKTGLRITTSD